MSSGESVSHSLSSSSEDSQTDQIEKEDFIIPSPVKLSDADLEVDPSKHKMEMAKYLADTLVSADSSSDSEDKG